MISREATLSIIALSALVTITSWMAIKNSEIPPETGIVTQTGVVQNLSLNQTNQLGQLAYSATIDSITQFSNGNNNFMNLNATAYNQNNDPPWHLIAPNGQTLDNNNQIVLAGNVVLFREATAKASAIRVETQSATIYSQENYAQTTYPIKIYEPGTKNVTTAVGANANFKTQQVSLLSQVISTYEPYLHH